MSNLFTKFSFQNSNFNCQNNGFQLNLTFLSFSLVFRSLTTVFYSLLDKKMLRTHPQMFKQDGIILQRQLAQIKLLQMHFGISINRSRCLVDRMGAIIPRVPPPPCLILLKKQSERNGLNYKCLANLRSCRYQIT